MVVAYATTALLFLSLVNCSTEHNQQVQGAQRHRQVLQAVGEFEMEGPADTVILGVALGRNLRNQFSLLRLIVAIALLADLKARCEPNIGV